MSNDVVWLDFYWASRWDSYRLTGRLQQLWRRTMNESQKRQMFGYMSTFDDDSLPDGARQSMLEWAAEDWAEMEGVDVDGFVAFMEYVKNDR